MKKSSKSWEDFKKEKKDSKQKSSSTLTYEEIESKKREKRAKRNLDKLGVVGEVNFLGMRFYSLHTFNGTQITVPQGTYEELLENYKENLLVTIRSIESMNSL